MSSVMIIPVILACLVEDPKQCANFNGTPVTYEYCTQNAFNMITQFAQEWPTFRPVMLRCDKKQEEGIES